MSLTACRHATVAQHPEDLRDAYLQALSDDDPATAYALLAPDLQAVTDFDDFAKRWQDNRAEREAQLASAAQTPSSDPYAVSRTGTTAHADGVLVHWVEIDGEYRVIQGLPGLPDHSSPLATLRAFVQAARDTDLSQLAALLGPELGERTAATWSARADAIESALKDPATLEFDPHEGHATLRYLDPTEGERRIVLEATDGRWMIVALE